MKHQLQIKMSPGLETSVSSDAQVRGTGRGVARVKEKSPQSPFLNRNLGNWEMT